jgi:signal transduction histidine kinase
VTLIVRDDGIGFDTEKSNGSIRFGLARVQERTELVGGELNNHSVKVFEKVLPYLT